jgi:hypothetical protein
MPYLIFLLLSISLWASEVPEWFSAMSYQSTAAKFVGYGEDTTLAIALQNAKNDIAGQIKTRVSSTLTQNKTLRDDTYHHEVIDFLEQKRFSTLKITTKSK